MLFSRLLIQRIKFPFSFRFQSTDRNLIDELNNIKSKDLKKLLNEQQTKEFLQLKRSFGGKFQSLQQFQNQSNFQMNFKKFFDDLLSLKTQNDEQQQQHRIHIEPRLTPKTVVDIESVCSLDYTSSHLNWSIVKTTNVKDQFQVEQWNSLEVKLDRKYNFIKTYNQLSDSLSTIPLNTANVLLVEQPTYRYPNLKIATYVSQLQQIRAVLNTLLHCQLRSQRPVYHITGRDVAGHFGLFIGNEQSSAEFFLTNLIFNNIGDNQIITVNMDDKLKMNYHQTSRGQREPMAQCLLRAFAFLQCVTEKKGFSLNQQ